MTKRSIATSAAIHGAVLVGLAALPAHIVTEPQKTRQVDVFFHQPAPAEPVAIARLDVPEPPKPRPRAKAKPLPPPARPTAAVEPAPAIVPDEPPRTARVEPPPLPETRTVEVKPPPPRPRPQVRTDVFRDARAAVAVTPEAREVAPRVGGFEAAPAEAPAPESSRARTGVRATGFDGAAVASNDSSPRAPIGQVRSAGFGDRALAVSAEMTPRRERPVQKLDSPVEIVSKPKPVYTQKARELRIEGEIVLEVTFDASGELRVLRVLERLGHGLDEAAVEAAKRIEFKPARRNGQPVDHTATLRVVFRLA